MSSTHSKTIQDLKNEKDELEKFEKIEKAVVNTAFR